MICSPRYKSFQVYKPVRQPKGSGGYNNAYELVSEVMGTVKSASASIQLVAQGNEQKVTHQGRFFNGVLAKIGPGYTDIEDGLIGEIGPDWLIVRRQSQFKVVSASQDEDNDSYWITATLVSVKVEVNAV